MVTTPLFTVGVLALFLISITYAGKWEFEIAGLHSVTPQQSGAYKSSMPYFSLTPTSRSQGEIGSSTIVVKLYSLYISCVFLNSMQLIN